MSTRRKELDELIEEFSQLLADWRGGGADSSVCREALAAFQAISDRIAWLREDIRRLAREL